MPVSPFALLASRAARLVVLLSVLVCFSPLDRADASTVWVTPMNQRCVSPATSPVTSLADPRVLPVARMLVSSAENSTLAWERQYGYIEYNVEGNAAENRGYTAGLVGFTTRDGDLRQLVRRYTQVRPVNPLARFLPALRRVEGSSSTAGLGTPFVRAWRTAATTPVFRRVQRAAADRVYLTPALAAARQDGLGVLGQFIYYDAMVMHGPGDDPSSFGGIRAAVLKVATPPSQGGDQAAFLQAFLDRRVTVMRSEQAHSDVSRVTTAQQAFLDAGNLNLSLPLSWSVYGDAYRVLPTGSPGC